MGNGISSCPVVCLVRTPDNSFFLVGIDKNVECFTTDGDNFSYEIVDGTVGFTVMRYDFVILDGQNIESECCADKTHSPVEFCSKDSSGYYGKQENFCFLIAHVTAFSL